MNNVSMHKSSNKIKVVPILEDTVVITFYFRFCLFNLVSLGIAVFVNYLKENQRETKLIAASVFLQCLL